MLKESDMTTAWVRVAANGRLSLPVEVRRQLGVEKGGDLVLSRAEDGAVTLMTAEAAVRRVQRLARERFGDKLPSVDEFLAYKREQAALEERKMRRLAGEEVVDADEIA
jgi:bifunctional DNA-binding transcriptional regulator/antitoxin component of YhaV-PrlF toxin-antitoxin module